MHFNALLNKTRVDNLPPLQELSVFEQSFESRRKQTANPVLRSRSKNYRNFDTGSYNGSQHTGNMNSANLIIEDTSANNEKIKITNPQLSKGKKEEKKLKSKLKSYESNEMLIDNSLSVVSNMPNSGKEVLIKTGGQIMRQETAKLPSRMSTTDDVKYYKNMNSSITSHSRFIKVRAANPIKSGQL